MVALLVAFAAFASQDEFVGPPLPEGPASPPAVPSAPSAERFLPTEANPSAPTRLADRVEAGPSLSGFLAGSVLVMALLVGLFALLKRFGRNSRFLAGGGPINVLARRPLGQRQEVLLVEVGTKVFVVGSTRDHLSTLGEFTHPDEVAVLRANLPGRKEDSMKLAFRESLREGLREEEAPEPAAGRVYDSIAGELAEIRKTVRAWRA